MSQPHAWSSTRSLIITLALVALILSSALETRKWYPLKSINEQILQWSMSPGIDPHMGFSEFKADGTIEYGMFDREGSFPLGVKKTIPPPAILKVWSPVLGSISLSVLVVFVMLARRPGNRGGVASDSLYSRAKNVLRYFMIAIALVGLNVACLHFPPRMDPDPLADVIPNGKIQLGPDGKVTDLRGHRLPGFEAAMARLYPESILPPRDGITIFDIRTMVCKEDGSVVGYEGEPGNTRSRPILLYPPVRSPLTMWAPFLFGLTTTVVVLVVLWRQWRSNRATDDMSGNPVSLPSGALTGNDRGEESVVERAQNLGRPSPGLRRGNLAVPGVHRGIIPKPKNGLNPGGDFFGGG